MTADTREVWVVRPADLGATLPSSGDLRLEPLGTLDEVKTALSKVFSEATWMDPWAAVVDGDGWMAEINVRVGEPIQELTLRIHGRARPPDYAFDEVRALCVETGWRAIDLDTWEVVA